ncbi:hypothetical protein TSAR_015657 [Trichomalopsis sarcophagae]|uniref:Uncharacterized protein n=1 Tax=Trichomalopsis sarcophagae TaxID=543379 RepID=A0A232FJH3_9HYME|nr:hypothetical protein TSAR_015657 [Trichomalopsis sarcophagae]
MPPSRGSNQQPSQPPPTQKNSSTGRARGGRYVLSARAQAVLTWILEDIIEKTLEDARRQAEAAGKQRVELAEHQSALRILRISLTLISQPGCFISADSSDEDSDHFTPGASDACCVFHLSRLYRFP